MTRLRTGQNFRNGCGQNFRNWQKVLATWHDLASDTGRVLLATGRFVGEGFDDPLLDTLVLASPVSWRGTLVQYVGRLTRESPGKRDLVVYDYLDGEIAVLRRMFERRRLGYRSLGFEVAPPPATATFRLA